MTIVESIKCVLQQNNDGLTSKQIYDEIIRQGLYSFGAENPDTLYSEPANGVAVLETVYVDQTNGNDSNPGIESAPVKTIEAAAAKLKPADEGGTADNNQIILLQNFY